ncbi:MAG: hypothetical protein NW200_08230 [Hyphomonadaceae bacterium]|nr:hypothetical protein [Hyphomonadaceae bacterium]
MTAYPIASSASGALAADAPVARTAPAAARIAGGLVFLAAEEAPGAFADIAAAEAAIPGLYGDGRYELVWRDDAWRVLVRFWRIAPPAPVARSAAGAVRKPLGAARTPDEARALLGAPAELVAEPLPRTYRTLGRARSAFRQFVEHGLARIEEREGGYVVLLSYWRPVQSPGRIAKLAPVERDELAQRAAAPLRAEGPQADPFVGLFERLAPENPAIVLAEEGDGRTRGE